MPKNTDIAKSNPVYTAVKQLGLTDNEAGLYVLSLNLGPTTIASLADKMNISRPNVYKIIKGLEVKGLAVTPKRGVKQRKFSVLSPTIVNDLLEKQLEESEKTKKMFASILPDLLGNYKRGDLPSKVQIYQGHTQYHKAFFSTLDEARGGVSFFGSVDHFLDLIDMDEQEIYLKERVKRGLSSRTLTLAGAHADRIAKEDKERLRETRVIDTLTPFATSFHLFADKVIFWQPDGLLAIKIEDDLIVEMLKNVFEFLWGQAKRPETSNL